MNKFSNLSFTSHVSSEKSTLKNYSFYIEEIGKTLYGPIYANKNEDISSLMMPNLHELSIYDREKLKELLKSNPTAIYFIDKKPNFHCASENYITVDISPDAGRYTPAENAHLMHIIKGAILEAEPSD